MPATRSIGRFRISGLLGTGAFSAVYLAVDDRIGGDVAVKVLADHHSLDPEIRERFIAEARMLRRLTSPHVVRLHELDETDQRQPFHVLEYVAGGNLAALRRSMVDAGRRVTTDDVRLVASNLATALTVLHAARVVHRDLAPKNLLVRREPASGPEEARTGRGLFASGDQLVLADLGISKDLSESSGLTAAAGTAGFAAPEQRTVGIIDERADVYAASAVLVWLVTGERPGDDVAADVSAAGFDRRLGEVLASGLANHPDGRPTTIEDWHRAVGAALDPPTPVTPMPAPAPAPAPAARPVSRRWVAVVGALALVLGVGVGVALGRLADGTERPSSTVVVEGARLRAEGTSGDVIAAFTGPSELVVGERARFTAAVSGASTWTWYGVGGEQLANEAVIDLTPTAPGALTLRLVAVGPGTTATATATFTVVGA